MSPDDSPPDGSVVTREMARASRVCWRCDVTGTIRAVAYLWTFQHGGVMPLCVECCAFWRAENDANPDLAPPLRVETAPAALTRL